MLTALLRRSLRRGRSVPLVGAFIRAVDRRWWVRTILLSGLVDAEFYAAQRGKASLRERAAVRHYVRRGWRAGLSLNPLFDETVAGRGLPESHRVPAMYAYVVSDNKSAVSVHPWWDAPAYARDAPGADAHAMGPLGHVWTHRRDARISLAAGSVDLVVDLADHIGATLAFAREFARAVERPRTDEALAEQAPHAVVRIMQRAARRYEDGLIAAAELAHDGGQAVVAAVDVGAGEWIAARQLSLIAPRLEIRRFPRGATFGEVVNETASRLGAEKLLVIGPTVSLSTPDARALLASVRAGLGVVPLAVRQTGAVDALGAVLRGAGAPYRFLHDHPIEDAARFGDGPVAVSALTGQTFALQLADFRAVGGLDTTLVNDLELEAYSVRATEQDGRRSFVALPAVQAWQLDDRVAFADAPAAENARRFATLVEGAPIVDPAGSFSEIGFDVRGWTGETTHPVPILDRSSATPRWAIKICSPAGPAGQVWGDTHFAAGLAGALRRQDITVVIDAFDARERATSYLDDVTVVVRGPYRIDPPARGVRILWIISHPDQITLDELRQFDLVFAASERWAAKTTAKWGVPVLPLLECTDRDLFHPRGLERGDDIVFVGTSRGIARPCVVAPLNAGIPVKVYGPDWRGYIPASAIVSTSIPNDRLSARYETASIVLNDQWPAMKREGFMAMRLFDAVAAGGRVISERVDGVPELFGGAVVAFDSPEHLVELLRGDVDALFPDAGALAAATEMVRREHSFDARAATLVEAAHAHGEDPQIVPVS